MNEVDVKAQKKEDDKRAEMRNHNIEQQERRSNAIHSIRQNEIRAHTAAAEQASDRLGS